MDKLIAVAYYGIIWSKIYLHLVRRDIDSNNPYEIRIILG